MRVRSSRPVGWRYESVRHSLAARGVVTRKYVARTGLGAWTQRGFDVAGSERVARVKRSLGAEDTARLALQRSKLVREADAESRAKAIEKMKLPADVVVLLQQANPSVVGRVNFEVQLSGRGVYRSAAEEAAWRNIAGFETSFEMHKKNLSDLYTAALGKMQVSTDDPSVKRERAAAVFAAANAAREFSERLKLMEKRLSENGAVAGVDVRGVKQAADNQAQAIEDELLALEYRESSKNDYLVDLHAPTKYVELRKGMKYGGGPPNPKILLPGERVQVSEAELVQ